MRPPSRPNLLQARKIASHIDPKFRASLSTEESRKIIAAYRSAGLWPSDVTLESYGLSVYDDCGRPKCTAGEIHTRGPLLAIASDGPSLEAVGALVTKLKDTLLQDAEANKLPIVGYDGPVLAPFDLDNTNKIHEGKQDISPVIDLDTNRTRASYERLIRKLSKQHTKESKVSIPIMIDILTLGYIPVVWTTQANHRVISIKEWSHGTHLMGGRFMGARHLDLNTQRYVAGLPETKYTIHVRIEYPASF